MSEKETLLGELYALRAGISAISMERDAVKQIEGEYESELKKLKDTLPSKNWKRPVKEREIKEKSEKRLALLKKDKEGYLAYPYPDPKEIEIPPFRRSRRKIGCLVTIVFSVVAATILAILSEDIYYAAWGFVFSGIISLVSLFIFWLDNSDVRKEPFYSGYEHDVVRDWTESCPSCRCATKRGYEKHWREKLRRAEINYNDWKKSLQQVDEQIVEAVKEADIEFATEMAAFDAEYEAKEARIAEIENTVQTQGAPYIEKAAALYRSLEKQYKRFLDVRDWQHVDLILFYLETGRADSLKEALPMVDQQNQANMIAGAIARAAEEISYSIRSGLSALRSTMVQCFDSLSNQLTTMQNDLGKRLDSTNSTLQAISASVDFDNALRAKANADSMALMADVRHMRTLAESADANRRFGTP